MGIMITFILLSHILLAVLSLGFASGVIIATRKQNLDIALSRTKTMWYGTISTVFSGVFLAIITGSSFGRTCTTLLTFLVLVLIAHYYQRAARQKTGCPYLDEL
jgi:riboflavin transporter FmnP